MHALNEQYQEFMGVLSKCFIPWMFHDNTQFLYNVDDFSAARIANAGDHVGIFIKHHCSNMPARHCCLLRTGLGQLRLVRPSITLGLLNKDVKLLLTSLSSLVYSVRIHTTPIDNT